MVNKMIKYESHSEAETENIAKGFATKLNVNSIVVLSGELGAGKTLFMRGIGKHFGIEKDISSPTFTIVNEYKSDKIEHIYHFDVYRIPDEANFIESVGTEYFDSGLCIIEWGEKISSILPTNTIYVNISKKEIDDENNVNEKDLSDSDYREITIEGGGF